MSLTNVCNTFVNSKLFCAPCAFLILSFRTHSHIYKWGLEKRFCATPFLGSSRKKHANSSLPIYLWAKALWFAKSFKSIQMKGLCATTNDRTESIRLCFECIEIFDLCTEDILRITFQYYASIKVIHVLDTPKRCQIRFGVYWSSVLRYTHRRNWQFIQLQ